MNRYSRYETYRPVTGPYTQPEPPHYTPGPGMDFTAIRKWVSSRVRRWSNRDGTARRAA